MQSAVPEAEILIRMEDLAFVLCWADETGWFASCSSLHVFLAATCSVGNIADIELPRLGLRFKAG